MAREEKTAPATRITPKPAFDLSNFELESCTLEVRYPFALPLWDKAGQLWKVIQEKWPDMTPEYVDPRKTEFQAGDSRLAVEFEQSRISTSRPDRSLEQFSKESKDFIRIATHHLQISTYKRVGFRLLYFKRYKDKREAAAAFFSLGLVKIPEGKKFEIEDLPINPLYGLRWESEKKGLALHARMETRVVDVEVVQAARELMKPIHEETSGIVLDFDYYTVAPLETGQMDTSEWMKHAMHLIARDSRYLFGE